MTDHRIDYTPQRNPVRGILFALTLVAPLWCGVAALIVAKCN